MKIVVVHLSWAARTFLADYRRGLHVEVHECLPAGCKLPGNATRRFSQDTKLPQTEVFKEFKHVCRACERQNTTVALKPLIWRQHIFAILRSLRLCNRRNLQRAFQAIPWDCGSDHEHPWFSGVDKAFDTTRKRTFCRPHLPCLCIAAHLEVSPLNICK